MKGMQVLRQTRDQARAVHEKVEVSDSRQKRKRETTCRFLQDSFRIFNNYTGDSLGTADKQMVSHKMLDLVHKLLQNWFWVIPKLFACFHSP